MAEYSLSILLSRRRLRIVDYHVVEYRLDKVFFVVAVT
jgi:hypothetical protein